MRKMLSWSSALKPSTSMAASSRRKSSASLFPEISQFPPWARGGQGSGTLGGGQEPSRSLLCPGLQCGRISQFSFYSRGPEAPSGHRIPGPVLRASCTFPSSNPHTPLQSGTVLSPFYRRRK